MCVCGFEPYQVLDNHDMTATLVIDIVTIKLTKIHMLIKLTISPHVLHKLSQFSICIDGSRDLLTTQKNNMYNIILYPQRRTTCIERIGRRLGHSDYALSFSSPKFNPPARREGRESVVSPNGMDQESTTMILLVTSSSSDAQMEGSSSTPSKAGFRKGRRRTLLSTWKGSFFSHIICVRLVSA